MGGGEITAAAAEEEDDGVLLFPPHLCDSLQELEFSYCTELQAGEGWLKALRSLQRLTIKSHRLKQLKVTGFADWDPNPRRALEDAEGGEEQQTQLVSSTLRELGTDDIAGLLAAPICSFLSSSLAKLKLYGYGSQGMERFIKEQEDALQLLSSLQELEFWYFKDLEQLPAGLRNLTSLKILSVNFCTAISSLPSDGLPDSLEMLDVYECSEELNEKCRGLVGTIPRVRIV